MFNSYGMHYNLKKAFLVISAVLLVVGLAARPGTQSLAGVTTNVQKSISAQYAPMSSALHGSYKMASRCKLAFGEKLTYMIRLHNSGTSDTTANVSDPIPDQLQYIEGSVTGGGSYDSGTGTLSWTNVNVPPGRGLSLTFQATQAISVTEPTVITNTATISTVDDSIQRWARIVLVPGSDRSDKQPPVVQSLTIGEQDVVTDPSVTLHISATDNVEVRWMFLAEWYLEASPIPRWRAVHSSGWVPFQADYPWTLANASGAHFVGVWAVDGAFNHSHLDRQALDYASLLLPGTTLPAMRVLPYLVYYDANVDVTATLATASGNADLYVWYPGSYGRPDQSSRQPGTAPDEVHFTTPKAGTYFFLVHAMEASTYTLDITPAGGPRPSLALSEAGGTAAEESAPLADDPIQNLLSLSGLDPLHIAQAPDGPFLVYLPGITSNR